MEYIAPRRASLTFSGLGRVSYPCVPYYLHQSSNKYCLMTNQDNKPIVYRAAQMPLQEAFLQWPSVSVYAVEHLIFRQK